MDYPIEIVPCPIIREPDGLAMSSRNQLLTPECRNAAPIICQTLKKAKSMAGNAGLDEIISFVSDTINSNPCLKLEYFQMVETASLKPLNSFPVKSAVTACIAVKAGAIRLIDNIDFIS
jgi:pantoate--beta-alanine ligase